MEINGQKANLPQLMQNLPESSQSTSPQTTQGNSISVYRDPFSIPEAINQFKKLKQAFPQVPAGFYDVLLNRMIEHRFTEQRLKDAINNLIDNFPYPVPSIANVISFDKRVKLYTYNELCDQIYAGYKNKDFAKVRLKGKVFWIKASDKETFNIPDEL